MKLKFRYKIMDLIRHFPLSNSVNNVLNLALIFYQSTPIMEELQEIYNLVLTSSVLRENFANIDNPEQAIHALLDIAKENGISLNEDALDFVLLASQKGYDQNHLGLDPLRWGLFSLIRVACVSAQRKNQELVEV